MENDAKAIYTNYTKRYGGQRGSFWEVTLKQKPEWNKDSGVRTIQAVSAEMDFRDFLI